MWTPGQPGTGSHHHGGVSPPQRGCLPSRRGTPRRPGRPRGGSSCPRSAHPRQPPPSLIGGVSWWGAPHSTMLLVPPRGPETPDTLLKPPPPPLPGTLQLMINRSRKRNKKREINKSPPRPPPAPVVFGSHLPPHWWGETDDGWAEGSCSVQWGGGDPGGDTAGSLHGGGARHMNRSRSFCPKGRGGGVSREETEAPPQPPLDARGPAGRQRGGGGVREAGGTSEGSGRFQGGPPAPRPLTRRHGGSCPASWLASRSSSSSSRAPGGQLRSAGKRPPQPPVPSAAA